MILARGMREHYFKDGGHRARGLDVELNDVSWIGVEASGLRRLQCRQGDRVDLGRGHSAMTTILEIRSDVP
ncbi:hypothetical protein [Kitasatospora sp. McL0602]|uniref:hypothetical protein n=1 Tax=Kitasatospora sp. McL0602 TaxID=3439530 RepID=UPI003F88CFC9